MGNSTIPLQAVVDSAQDFGDISPVLNVSAHANQPALTIANDVLMAMLAEETPWKWNQIIVPQFYTNSYQQDYAVPGLTTLAWLQGGIVIDINSTSVPKAFRYIEVNRDQRQTTATFLNNSLLSNPAFLVNWLPNDQLYYGTWGAAGTGNATLGNNPVSGSVYTNPLSVPSQPFNPIAQIKDANGNLLVLTGYGTEGTTAPVAPASSAAGVIATPGSGATTVWTVVDPKGQGFRIQPPVAQTGTVWQFNLVGQARPVRFTALGQMLDPIPDDFEPHFRAGFIAQCYRYSSEAKIAAKFPREWANWLLSIKQAKQKTEHERDEYGFVPERGIFGGSPRTSGPNPLRPFDI